ncbi:MAG: acyltransferase [Thermoanaerobaculia bacterium]
MFYSLEELRDLGVQFGRNVQIDRSVRLFNPAGVRIGSNVRIDCFSVLSAGDDGLEIGDHVHLAMGVGIFGASARVTIEDFAGLSARVVVFSGNDDYRDGFLTGPTVPMSYRRVTAGPVTFRRHAIIGAGSVILPGVEIGVGASVGALSLVHRPVGDFEIVAGSPARRIGERSREILERERALRDEESHDARFD